MALGHSWSFEIMGSMAMLQTEMTARIGADCSIAEVDQSRESTLGALHA